MRILRRHIITIAVAFVTAAVTAGAPVVAATFDARNADKVDGRHAVGAGAKPGARAGKLVATNAKGRLPNNIIAKAVDADRLDGLDSSRLQRRLSGSCTAAQKLLSVRPGGGVSCGTDRIDGGNAQTLDGLDSTDFQRRAALTVYVAPGATPQQSGSRLRLALTSIPAQGAGGSPSHEPGARWTVRLEPGVYDLGTTELVTRSHVDIVGAGMRHTVLQCDCGQDLGEGDPDEAAVVHLADDAELHGLTVRNFNPQGGTPAAATGVRMFGGQGALHDVAVQVGSSMKSTGVRAAFATLRLIDSYVEVEGALQMGAWLAESGSTVFVVGSQIHAPGGAAVRYTDPALSGGDGQNGSARVAASLLDGTATSATAKCVGAYTADYVPRTANCGT